MKIVPSVLLATVASFVLVGAASAADLATVAAPVPAVPAASLENTLSLEFTPEFYATNYSGFNNTTKPSGALADDVFKLAYSHTFAGVWVLGGNVAYTKRTSYDSNRDAWQVEVNGGYKFKFGDFTLTPGAGIGYGWGYSKINPANAWAEEAYYFVTLNGDWKINSNWTWNAFSLRYRDAFNVDWNTPKVATGVTYSILPSDAVYANVGYSWKNKFSHDLELGNDYADKYSISVGYKHSF